MLRGANKTCCYPFCNKVPKLLARVAPTRVNKLHVSPLLLLSLAVISQSECVPRAFTGLLRKKTATSLAQSRCFTFDSPTSSLMFHRSVAPYTTTSCISSKTSYSYPYRSPRASKRHQNDNRMSELPILVPAHREYTQPPTGSSSLSIPVRKVVTPNPSSYPMSRWYLVCLLSEETRNNSVC